VLDESKSSLLLLDFVSTTFIPGKIRYHRKKGVEVKVHFPNLGRFTVAFLFKMFKILMTYNLMLNPSVADPGCLSRILGPDFYPFRIPNTGSQILDPGSKNLNNREWWTKICCQTFFCSQQVPKIVKYLFFKCWRKILGQYLKNYRTFFPDSGPGVKKAPDPGSATLLNPILVKKNAKQLPLKMYDFLVSVFSGGHFFNMFQISTKFCFSLCKKNFWVFIKYLRYKLSIFLSIRL
jgi:hypothetical protein